MLYVFRFFLVTVKTFCHFVFLYISNELFHVISFILFIFIIKCFILNGLFVISGQAIISN